MPELPEVEVSRMGIAPHIEGHKITRVNVYDARLRWPVPEQVHQVEGGDLIRVKRRAKYLLLETEQGVLILHLGMSGKLRVVPIDTPRVKHDHIQIEFSSGQCLRLNDPRRFGALLFTEENVDEHKLLAMLGPEPLTEHFNADYLFERSRDKKQPIKTFIMDNHQVVGVGNIYANEALFKAGIHPKRAAGAISKARYERLVMHIKETLAEAIKQGGTTLRDFTRADGSPGYFAQKLQVYGRGGKMCMRCKKPLREIRLGQRSTVYCTQCQR
ncbi:MULTISPECIES: bifunctional DNA-formamidopyrimidine glycosylase/DNA-(apurinic or apyrimidinic site) lyase [unclassified Idiomarina]|uniref:bifunctional DNA-formamidopyrimidine glycosylase/DNA-(apurinic or apyrimidinic site) lyase n=1 Tax=unclassified Idiomarina TaxID=2614829 RepID=UPI000C8F6DF6|nr:MULTISPECIES: bifunctional DNA-formamidopyrimidine glycosylase/DNA-(apurinic or apyrimidinic site) lyase [unclassified Idiomarina]MAD53533.1 DNA-formamidopyrimidine glycosylase [Idiomarinaceae bacterium]MEC9320129.1 bifunctional DNA-formamidopyrimidine glycosylase/DNA-(apurinic or apyrimidinic site) lyase [Pseudomonadota bacterium]NQZ03157.1 bifunctional DNA-formamidopyrimidine glycosylase/DNA-(apurinic or apyrimidinic site) lyase [Idiomarina sp.]